ncbi:carbohydrate ABC transporter permease [Paenibacillus sacheonensis]|uniref:ABC transporter permease subunit n=1 Tax=Paenibacillus sacheonensis TaxID=742054 RepID=A0A7X4YK24_9BACL|nr:sugar ABC transporter permease [Paenibacillus sacheonensis]MBM7563915.1 multiple sugar transport system permease protein [Paenibacillus sacheonensis]NBC67738.1 ABC transporter permease subunit [Paenibacillus sacheonensis]
MGSSIIAQKESRFKTTQEDRVPKLHYRLRKELWCLAFIAPQLALFLLFTAYPIVMSYVYAFFDWNGYGPLKEFTGFDNFTETLKDPIFWNAFRNSLLFMMWLVLVQVPLALLAALLMNAEWLKGKIIYRTIIFLPVVTTTAVVGLVMRFVFGAYKGLFNEMLLKIGLIAQPVDWLGSVDTALLIVVIVGIWKSFGMKMVYWLAGIQSLPKEVFESARIDGASSIQLLRYITIPLLLPVGSVIVLMSAVNALHVFDLVQTMTGGGPAFKTDMVDVYIYRYAFSGSGEARVGFASAAGVLYGIVVMGISILLGLFVRLSGGRRNQKRF